MKEALILDLMMVNSDFLQTNALTRALGSVLSQQLGGNVFLVFFISCKLLTAEQKYVELNGNMWNSRQWLSSSCLKTCATISPGSPSPLCQTMPASTGWYRGKWARASKMGTTNLWRLTNQAQSHGQWHLRWKNKCTYRQGRESSNCTWLQGDDYTPLGLAVLQGEI